MVQWGFRPGLNYYNMRDARAIVKRLGLDTPKKSQFRKYGPLKAIALDVFRRYIEYEPLEQCLARYMAISKNLSTRVEGISSVSFVEQGEDL